MKITNKSVLVTGANGEIGHLLLPELARKKSKIITLDINPLAADLTKYSTKNYEIDITDQASLKNIFSENDIDIVIHLAAILSTQGEKNIKKAHQTNADGTFNLFSLSENKLFFFPSSIAAYGLPQDIDQHLDPCNETQHMTPLTIYGATKIYGEVLGNYFNSTEKLDFRAIRFPGLISAETVPSGGTSDYGPEMLHKSSRGEAYECFVNPETTIPFMVMPDAISAIIGLIEAPKEKLTQHVYNVTSFSMKAKDFENIARENFSEVKVTYKSDPVRQKIVDSWPDAMDDTKAREDWGWKPEFDQDKAFKKYILPGLRGE